MKEFLERIEKARFETPDELYFNKETIRKEFQSFDSDTKTVYKWYFFFQLCLLKNPFKEQLWNYINKENVSERDVLDLFHEYRLFNERRARITQNQRKQVVIVENEENDKIIINSIEDLQKFI